MATLRTLFFVIRVNGTSSQIMCITGRTRHREMLSVLPWTLHTRRGRKGLNGQVLLQDQFSTEWTYGKDPYPPNSSDYL